MAVVMRNGDCRPSQLLLPRGTDHLKVVPQTEPRQSVGGPQRLAGDDAQAVASLLESAEDSVGVGVGNLVVSGPGGGLDAEGMQGGHVLPHTHGAKLRHLGGDLLIGDIRTRDGIADPLLHGGGLVHNGGAHIEK